MNLASLIENKLVYMRGDKYAGAVYSNDDPGPDCNDATYRYVLWRRWDDTPEGVLLAVMLNPSTANHIKPDPTVAGLCKRAQDWSRSGVLHYRVNELRVVNMYAVRSKSPAILKRHEDPVGRFNEQIIADEFNRADTVLCAWGRHASKERVAWFRSMLADIGSGSEGKICVLRTLDDGTPEHPLYIPHVLPPKAWSPT